MSRRPSRGWNATRSICATRRRSRFRAAAQLLPIVTPQGARIALGDVADVRVVDGPPCIKSENARLNGWTYVDIADAIWAPMSQRRSRWSQIQSNCQRVFARLVGTVRIHGARQGAAVHRRSRHARDYRLLLYLNFRRFAEVCIIIGTLPMALIGGLWLLYLLGYDLSVAVGVGFIALAGVAVEIGVVMLVYLNQAIRRHMARQKQKGGADHGRRQQAVIDGAVLRVRPIMMTVAAIIAGLLPIMFGGGTGSEVMRRIAAPMVGGMISATILTLVVIPALFLLWRSTNLHPD